MDVFIYDADIYCEACGRELRRIKADDRTLNRHDSEDWPMGPYPDGGGEADCPQHCGSGPDCLNAINWIDGSKAGAFLENPLTEEGVAYVRELLDEVTGRPNEVTALWADFYREELSRK